MFWQRAWLRGCATRPESPIHSHPHPRFRPVIKSGMAVAAEEEMEGGDGGRRRKEEEQNQEEERATVRGALIKIKEERKRRAGQGDD